MTLNGQHDKGLFRGGEDMVRQDRISVLAVLLCILLLLLTLGCDGGPRRRTEKREKARLKARLAENPNDPQVLMRLAVLSTGDIAKAQAYTMRALEADPDYVPAWQMHLVLLGAQLHGAEAAERPFLSDRLERVARAFLSLLERKNPKNVGYWKYIQGCIAVEVALGVVGDEDGRVKPHALAVQAARQATRSDSAPDREVGELYLEELSSGLVDRAIEKTQPAAE